MSQETVKPEALFMADGHEVRPFVATKAAVARVVDFVNSFPLAADASVSLEGVVDFILHPLNILVESDDTLIMFENVMPGRHARIHFVFWDRKVTGKEKFLEEALRGVMAIFNLRKLTAHVPDKNRVMLRSLERLGFRREGRLRGEFLARNGQVYDTVVYGAFLEEIHANSG